MYLKDLKMCKCKYCGKCSCEKPEIWIEDVEVEPKPELD